MILRFWKASKIRSIYCIASIVLTSIAFSADESGGWSKSRWGMSEAEVLAAFPDQAVKVSDQPFRTWITPVIINKMLVAGVESKVWFRFDPQNRLLYSVAIEAADPSDANFQKLELGLIEKYGRPWHSTADSSKVSMWKLKTTTIRLTRTLFKPINKVSLWLIYEKPTQDAGL